MLDPAGTVVANGWADLTDGDIDNLIRYTEDGSDIGTGFVVVWTGTTEDGLSSSENCCGWGCTSFREFGTTGCVSK